MNSVCKFLTVSLAIFLSGCFFTSSNSENNTTPRPTSPTIDVEKVPNAVPILDDQGEVKSLLIAKNDFEHSILESLEYSVLNEDQVIEKAFLEGKFPFSDKLLSRTLPRVTTNATDYEIKIVKLDGIDREVAVKQFSNLNIEIGDLIFTDITYRLLDSANHNLNVLEIDTVFMNKTDQIVQNKTARFDSTNVTTEYFVKKQDPLSSISQVAQNAVCASNSVAGDEACSEFANLIQTQRNILNTTVNQFIYFESGQEENVFSFDISSIFEYRHYSPEFAVDVAISSRKTIYYSLHESHIVTLPGGDTATFYVDLVMFNYDKTTNSYKNVVIKGYYSLDSTPDKTFETKIYANYDNYEYK
ncbi:MAG TPA: hypothetical protein DCL21_00940 [Alphaproteobacteria bacterium]|nr:hypothetical protein [Alphaproteobacteria bacterium]